MIKNCTMCPLYNNMPFGPCVSNHFGDVYCIFSGIHMDSPISDEIVSGLDKQILRKLIPENRWYLSSLIRCSKGKNPRYSIKDIRLCSSWIPQEISENKPKYIITFGLNPYKFMETNQFEYKDAAFNKLSTHKYGDFLCMPSLHDIGRSSKILSYAQKTIGEYIGI